MTKTKLAGHRSPVIFAPCHPFSAALWEWLANRLRTKACRFSNIGSVANAATTSDIDVAVINGKLLYWDWEDWSLDGSAFFASRFSKSPELAKALGINP